MKIHRLKLAEEHVKSLSSGVKKAEYRKNDRNFLEGDIIKFCCPKSELLWMMPQFKITHVLILSQFGNNDYCVLSIEPIGKKEDGFDSVLSCKHFKDGLKAGLMVSVGMLNDELIMKKESYSKEDIKNLINKLMA